MMFRVWGSSRTFSSRELHSATQGSSGHNRDWLLESPATSSHTAQAWHLEELIMRCFFWLLFLPAVLCQENALEIKSSPLSAWNGSCVVIPCNIKRGVGGQEVGIISLIWYFGAHYENNLNDFVGTMLYNASRNHTSTTDPLFEGRVKFVGDLEQRNCSLKIFQLQKNDTGTYTARLYGLHKSKQERWAFSVQVNVMEPPPRPEMKLKDGKVDENQNTKVICSVPYHCPDEPLRLTLSGLEKRGMSLQEANEIGKIQTILTFTPTWNDHGKTLRCSLSHQDRREISQSTMLLNVNYAPKGHQVKATPKPTIRAGEKLSLNCIVKSNPPVQYQWYKDSERIYEWSDSKIEFNPVGEHNAGIYKCEVENTLGRSTKEVKIDVQYSPKETTVTVRPADIKEGVRVTLQCSSRGNPAVDQYKWYKSTRSGQIGTNKWLLFERIRLSDSGTYYCIAQNLLGNSSSASVTLDVRYPPKNVQLANQNPLSIAEENTLMLNCSAGSSNPPVAWYNWPDNARNKKKEGNLLIFQATDRDTGSYHCEACNSAGCTRSTPIFVDVLYGPKDVSIVRDPRGRIHEGSRVQMSCLVRTAKPHELTYMWYKDDKRLQVNSVHAGTWTISKVTSADSGTYSCEANNSMGKSKSSDITLDVLYGPRNVYVSLNTLETVTEGMDLKMLCKSDANPAAAYYEWSWNEEWKSLENSRILTLPKVQVRQTGTYRCRARNIISMGESEPLHLTVFFSRATVLKQTLIGLGSALLLAVFLGLLVFSLRNCKKKIDSSTSQTWRASFFVKKAKGRNFCPNNRSNEGQTERSLGFLNQGVEADISYATIMFPPSSSEDRTEYACIKSPKQAMAPADDTVIYSAVKKPRLPEKADAKHDYENVENNQEEEVHYSTLMNLGRQPCPIDRDSTTDSESEESIQYASLKH